MTKQELQSLYNRRSVENNVMEKMLFEIKRLMEETNTTFEKGLAEESDYNDGVKGALAVVAKIINSYTVSEYRKVPTFQKEGKVLQFQLVKGDMKE